MGLPSPSTPLAARLAAVLAAMLLAVLAPAPARAQEAALLVQVTSDTAGVVIPFAEVQVDSGGWMRAGLDGIWRGALPPGRHRVDARAPGYASRSFSVHVEAGEELALQIPIREDATILDPVTARAVRGRTRMLQDFHGRAARGRHGVFITRAMIEARPGVRFTDLVRVLATPRLAQGPAPIAAGRVSGISTENLNTVRTGIELGVETGSVVGFEAGVGANGDIEEECKPIFVVDGRIHALNPNSHPDTEFQMSEIEGIEVYSNGTFAPAPFTGRIAACGVIMIWTR